MSQPEDKVEVEEPKAEQQPEETGKRRSGRARAPAAVVAPPAPAAKKDPKAAKNAKKAPAKKDPKTKGKGKKKAASEDEEDEKSGSEDEGKEEKVVEDKVDEADDGKAAKDEDFKEEEDEEEEPSEEEEEEEEDFEEKPKKKGKAESKPAPAKKGKAPAADKKTPDNKKAPAAKAPAKGKAKKKEESEDDDDDFGGDDSEDTKPKGKGAAAGKKGAPAAGKKGKKDDDDIGGSVDDDTLVEYMRKTNRPYSLINIFDNLHGKVKKPVLLKMLEQLVVKNKLTCKEFGKARIYLINQDLLPQVDKHELETMQNDLGEKRTYLREIAEEIKETSKKVAVYNKQLTNAQIAEEIAKLEKNIKNIDEKMAFYKSDKFIQAPEAEVHKYEEAHQKMEKEYKKRRRMCKDGVGQIADGMNKKLSEVQELIGIEEEDA